MVIGAGIIGLLVIQALRISGCGQIVAVDPAEQRLKLAKQLGADIDLNPDADDVATRIRQVTGRPTQGGLSYRAESKRRECDEPIGLLDLVVVEPVAHGGVRFRRRVAEHD